MSEIINKLSKMFGRLPKSVPLGEAWPEFDKIYSEIQGEINSALSNQAGTGLSNTGTTTGRIPGTAASSSNLPKITPAWQPNHGGTTPNVPYGPFNPGPLIPGTTYPGTSGSSWASSFPMPDPHSAPENIAQDLRCLTAIFNRFLRQIQEKAPLLVKLMEANGALLVFDKEKELIEIRDRKGRVYASKAINEDRLVNIKP